MLPAAEYEIKPGKPSDRWPLTIKGIYLTNKIIYWHKISKSLHDEVSYGRTVPSLSTGKFYNTFLYLTSPLFKLCLIN